LRTDKRPTADGNLREIKGRALKAKAF